MVTMQMVGSGGSVMRVLDRFTGRMLLSVICARMLGLNSGYEKGMQYGSYASEEALPLLNYGVLYSMGYCSAHHREYLLT